MSGRKAFRYGSFRLGKGLGSCDLGTTNQTGCGRLLPGCCRVWAASSLCKFNAKKSTDKEICLSLSVNSPSCDFDRNS
jgi:hypothetical protein